MASEPYSGVEIDEGLLPHGEFRAAWLGELEAKLGKANFFRRVRDVGKPSVYAIYFEDLPERGYLTAVTCGLSEAGHPKWKLGCPELIVTMKTRDIAWGLAAAYFASAFFGEKSFSYGDVFKLDHPIAQDSAMNAYLLFAPSFLNRDQAKFVLPDRTINLVGLYPIYGEEISTYDRIGLKAFWHADGFEMDNPKRGPVTLARN